MKIITIGSTKGGVGKSTIATNLAVAAAAEGKRVLIVDADVQASSMAFRSVRESDDIKAMAITTPTLHKDLTADLNFDIIIIDAGGRDSKVFRSAIAASDLVIIPVLPSVYDVWAAADTIELLREVRAHKDIDARILLNQLIPNSIMGREALDSLQEYETEIPLMETKLFHRAAFKNAVMNGQGVIESEPSGKAAAEIKELFKEINTLAKEKN